MTPEELEKLLKEKGLYNQSKRSSDYWRKRFMLLEDVMNNKGAEYMKSTEKIYEKATSDINIEIRSWYQRFATNEGISFAEAQKMLTGKELKEFHMTVEEYIEKGKTLGVSSKWAKELERASINVHVTRLEALKLQMKQQVEELTVKKSKGIDNLMRDIYSDSFYKTAYEFQKGFGVGSNFAKLDKKVIDNVLSKPWAADGSNFSQRIWGSHRAQLVNKLHEGLTLNLIQGKPPDNLIKDISETFNVDRKRAATLVYTEKAYFQSIAQRDSFKNLGVEEYEIVATLDSKTSDICQAMDGQHFKLDDFQIGSTAPPFHPRCRTATAPYFDDEFEDEVERAARDEEGNYYTVPADMKYDDWYDKFVNDAKEDYVSVYNYVPTYNIKKGEFNVDEMKQQFIQAIDNDEGSTYHKQMLQFYVNATDFIKDTDSKYPFAYSTKNDAIIYNPNHELFYDYDLNIVATHELSHRADILAYESWNNNDFIKAIESTIKKVYDEYDKYEQLFNATDGKYKEDDSLSDIFSALTNDDMDLPAGHPSSYWKKSMKNKALEIFANISTIDQLGLSSKEEFNGILKELYRAYKRIVGD